MVYKTLTPLKVKYSIINTSVWAKRLQKNVKDWANFNVFLFKSKRPLLGN